MNEQNQEQRLRIILNTTYDAFVGVDQDGLIIEWNPQAEKLFGWRHEEAIGQKMDEMIIPERYRIGHQQGMKRFNESGESKVFNRRIQLEATRKNGDEFPTEMAITYIINDGKFEFYAFIHDISSRKSEERRLNYLTSNDALTGLRNRAYFNTSLPEAMARCRRNKTRLALLYFDIDHFKSINDNLGHEAGDRLLREFASRIKHKLREVDIVSRLGGDEFTVIIEGEVNDENTGTVASNILQALQRGHWLGEAHLKITASIGIAIYDGRPVKADALVALADKAMYKAKHSGRNNFKILRFEDIELGIESKAQAINASLIQNAQSLLKIPDKKEADFLQNTLSAIRRHLAMDVAFISHFHDGMREFKVIDALAPNPPIAVGDSGLLEESYCQRVVDGRLPEIINDAFELPEAMRLPVTAILPVRAHMSVPIKMSNGDIYGTFCCFSYKPNQTLNDRDVAVMHVFADLIAQHLYTEAQAST